MIKTDICCYIHLISPSQKIDIYKLKIKSEKLLSKHKKYNISYLGYSLEDM